MNSPFSVFIDAGSMDDPNELPFKKGDVLIITDKTGKWWDAETKDGRKGSALFLFGSSL